MKKVLPIIALVFWTIHSVAQEFSQTIESKIIKSISENGQNLDLDIALNDFYSIKASKNQADGYLEITITSTNDKTETFKIKPLTLDRFKPMFKSYFVKLVKKVLEKDDLILTLEDNVINTIYSELLVFERIDNERPEIAKVELKNDVKILIYNHLEVYKK